MQLNELTEIIIGRAIKVHRKLGPGLLESTYEACLSYELTNAGLTIQKQIGLPLIYNDLKLEVGYRLDLLVEGKIVVEIKSIDTLCDIHAAQVLTYLRLSGAKIGLLINFNVTKLVNGIRRFIAKENSEAL